MFRVRAIGHPCRPNPIRVWQTFNQRNNCRHLRQSAGAPRQVSLPADRLDIDAICHPPFSRRCARLPGCAPTAPWRWVPRCARGTIVRGAHDEKLNRLVGESLALTNLVTQVQGRTTSRPEGIFQHFPVLGDFDVGKGHGKTGSLGGSEFSDEGIAKFRPKTDSVDCQPPKGREGRRLPARPSATIMGDMTWQD